jgi:hypothetical protein
MKPRPPGTIAEAVTLIKVAVGEDAMAREVGKTTSLVRQWSDPDADAKPSIGQCILLDALFRRQTGDEPPLLALYKREIAKAECPLAAGPAKDLRAQVLALQGDLGDIATRVSTAHDLGTLSTSDRARIAGDIRDMLRTGQQMLAALSDDSDRKRTR